MNTTTGKAKAAAIGALGNFAAIVALALQDGDVSNEDTGTIVSAGVIGIFTVYGVWKTRNRQIPEAVPPPERNQ